MRLCAACVEGAVSAVEGRRGETGRGDSETRRGGEGVTRRHGEGETRRGGEGEIVLLRPEEVARKLNISTRSVLRLLYEGKIKGVKIRRVWRVDRGSLNRYLLRLLAACDDGIDADDD